MFDRDRLPDTHRYGPGGQWEPRLILWALSLASIGLLFSVDLSQERVFIACSLLMVVVASSLQLLGSFVIAWKYNPMFVSVVDCFNTTNLAQAIAWWIVALATASRVQQVRPGTGNGAETSVGRALLAVMVIAM